MQTIPGAAWLRGSVSAPNLQPNRNHKPILDVGSMQTEDSTSADVRANWTGILRSGTLSDSLLTI